MLYETLKHGAIFFSMIYFGLVGGVFYEMKTLFFKPLEKNKVLTTILDSVFFVILALLFFFAVQFTNYGEIRFFLFLSFFLGFFLERITIGSMLAKFFKVLYNKIVNVTKKLKIMKNKKIKEEK